MKTFALLWLLAFAAGLPIALHYDERRREREAWRRIRASTLQLIDSFGSLSVSARQASRCFRQLADAWRTVDDADTQTR